MSVRTGSGPGPITPPAMNQDRTNMVKAGPGPGPDQDRRFGPSVLGLDRGTEPNFGNPR